MPSVHTTPVGERAEARPAEPVAWKSADTLKQVTGAVICSQPLARGNCKIYPLYLEQGQGRYRLTFRDGRDRITATYWVRCSLESTGPVLQELRQDFPRTRPRDQHRPW